MILTVERVREILPSSNNISDAEVQLKIESLETLIRKYTNNNFQARNMRTSGNIQNGKVIFDDETFFKANDTFQISQSLYNDGIYTYGKDGTFTDEDNVLITKVVYPPDVIMGVMNLLKWEFENRDKVGVKSESLSRYSVTYYDLDANSEVGYPRGLVAFLKPYVKAQF